MVVPVPLGQLPDKRHQDHAQDRHKGHDEKQEEDGNESVAGEKAVEHGACLLFSGDAPSVWSHCTPRRG